jgi:hypothetical protein
MDQIKRLVAKSKVTPLLPENYNSGKKFDLYYWFRVNWITAWIVASLLLLLVIGIFIMMIYLVVNVQPVVSLLSEATEQ